MERNIRIDIREWLGGKYKVFFAPFPDVRISCPFCGDEKGRLYIAYEDRGKTKKGHGYCHNEQTRHDFFELYSMVENLTDGETAQQLYDDNPDPTYASIDDIRKALAEPETASAEEVIDIPSPEWPVGYVSLFNLTQERWDELCPRYMKERKITKELCDLYYLGYCLSGPFKLRMIVPVYFEGKLVAFQGRAMFPCKERKYMFNEGIEIGRFLFNYDNVPAESSELILVEGVFDAWAVRRAGFPNVAASFGKHLTQKGTSTIARKFKKLLIFWDMDALPEIDELAKSLDGMVEVFVTFLDGKDADEATQEEVHKAITTAEPYSDEFSRMALKALLLREYVKPCID